MRCPTSNGVGAFGAIHGVSGCTVSVTLGSLGAVPPLLMFAPSAVAALHAAMDSTGREKLSSMEGRLPSHKSPATRVDHHDVWDDDFVSESALDRALPMGVTAAAPRGEFVGAANFAPSLTSLGTRHTVGLTPDNSLGYALDTCPPLRFRLLLLTPAK